jgi:hypothetical protein
LTSLIYTERTVPGCEAWIGCERGPRVSPVHRERVIRRNSSESGAVSRGARRTVIRRRCAISWSLCSSASDDGTWVAHVDKIASFSSSSFCYTDPTPPPCKPPVVKSRGTRRRLLATTFLIWPRRRVRGNMECTEINYFDLVRKF